MNLHSEEGKTTCFKTENQLNQLNYPVNLVDKVALPIHIQNLEKALNLNSFLKQVHSLIDDKRDEKINLTLSKQQSKDVRSSMYSFNKANKNKNWLKNILIDNSDESDDEDLDQSVQELLKLRKLKKTKPNIIIKGTKNGHLNSANLTSTNILSLNDSIPLNQLFKNDKSCKAQLKSSKKSSKKKLKSDEESIKSKGKDKANDIKEDNKTYQLTSSNYFEPVLNQPKDDFNCKQDAYLVKKNYSTDNEINLIQDTACLESKLLDDIKYESVLTDEILPTESNMNDFVNSFLTNMNDQIVYSNQLPDEIFETEEEISNGFQSQYDLNKLQSNKTIKDTVIDQYNQTNLLTTTTSNLLNTVNLPIIELGDKTIVDNQINELSSIEVNKLESKEEDKQNLAQLNLTKPTISISLNAPITTVTKTTAIHKPAVEESTEQPIITKLTKSHKKKDKSSKSILESQDSEQIQNKRKKVWLSIVKKDIPKAHKSRLLNRKDYLNNCKKLAHSCQKERRTVGIGILGRLNKDKRNHKKTTKEIVTYYKLKRNENDSDQVNKFSTW